MKIKYFSIIVCLLTSLNFNSCDYLASEEYLHEVDDLNDIWTTRKNIRQAWAACYGWIPNFTNMRNSWPFSGGGDEGQGGLDTYVSVQLARGKYNADNVGVNYWTHVYRAVRVCNQFLENSDRANDRLLAEGEIETYQADVRFLRAFYYSLLMEMYGPFVIVTHTVDYSSTDLPTTRNTLEECMQFLLDELNAVIKVLPNQADIINTDRGRPSKGAAMAVKARVLLWAASPLVNGNTDYSAFVQTENVPYFDQTYNEQKWKDAAAAYKAIIDLGQYQLFTMPVDGNASGQPYKTVPLGDFSGNDVAWPDGPAGIDPYQSFKALFAGGDHYWNSEAIWQVNVSGQQVNLTVVGWPRSHKASSGYDAGNICAIQKMVDAFFMNNGKTIEEEGESGGLYRDIANATVGDGKYILGATNPGNSPIRTSLSGAGVPNRCLNREPRFYATLGFQSRGYKQDDLAMPYYYADFRYAASDGYIETDRPSVRSGYPIVKYINDLDVRYSGNYEKQCPVFRLAEVYLSYAEALNEYDPTNPDIVKYLNQVRYRAGLPGYTLGSQDENRRRIKRERQVELAFECGKRYFDMRRWKDAENVQRDQWGNSMGLGGLIFGCNYLETDKFYERYVIDGYIFKKRDYFLPIPYQEVANHWGTMTQNPGW